MLLEHDDQLDASPLTVPSGKDEMNFAEFPIALLTDRAPKGQRIIKFEDQVFDERRKKLIPRKRVIEGSEEYGLPTATDDTVVLALIQLTKLKSDFTKREVEFTRLELINLLGWPNEGKNYDRIKLSLLRIKGVTYIYDNAWWDARQKKWTTRAFSILDNVEINDSRSANGQNGLFPSRIVWNEVVFDSFQTGFLRNIDFQLCMRLEHPTALRLYRFLGKRFYLKPDWTFNLKELAYEHIGLGRNYEGGIQIARKLQPAIDELEGIGFLDPLPESDRFLKKGREWSIRFVQKAARLPALPVFAVPVNDAKAELPALVTELINRGVTAKTAAELVQRHPAEYIERKLDRFDWDMKQSKPPKNPGGYLVTCLNDDYAAPPGYTPKAQRNRRAADKHQVDEKADDARRHRREEDGRARKVEAYWKTMTSPAQAEFKAECLTRLDAAQREAYEQETVAAIKKMRLDKIVRNQIRQLLDMPPEE